MSGSQAPRLICPVCQRTHVETDFKISKGRLVCGMDCLRKCIVESDAPADEIAPIGGRVEARLAGFNLVLSNADRPMHRIIVPIDAIPTLITVICDAWSRFNERLPRDDE